MKSHGLVFVCLKSAGADGGKYQNCNIKEEQRSECDTDNQAGSAQALANGGFSLCFTVDIQIIIQFGFGNYGENNAKERKPEGHAKGKTQNGEG